MFASGSKKCSAPSRAWRLRRAYDSMIKTRAKRDSLADAEADADFHLAVAEASHNVALMHVMRGIYNLLRMCMHHAWEVMYREPDSVRLLHEQHKAMLEAVLAGNADRAREAAHLHLSFVRETLQQRIGGRHVRRGKTLAPPPGKRTK